MTTAHAKPTSPASRNLRAPRRLRRDATLDDAVERFLLERLDVVDRRRPLRDGDVRELNRLLEFARRPMSRALPAERTSRFGRVVSPADALIALLKIRCALDRNYTRLLAIWDGDEAAQSASTARRGGA